MFSDIVHLTSLSMSPAVEDAVNSLKVSTLFSMEKTRDETCQLYLWVHSFAAAVMHDRHAILPLHASILLEDFVKKKR